MDVSVCIVNWNTVALLRRCLLSIEHYTAGVRHEVIVVDNASADDSVAMVAHEFPNVRLIASPDNLGFARGSNLAAAAAIGHCVLYLNPDTELVTDALTGMCHYLATHPECGAVGCRLLNSDGTIQLTCAAAFPNARNELASMLMLNRLFPRSPLFASRELNHWDHADSRDVECLSGACMMLRRDLARRLAGFDESLFMYGEDLDLCRRIQGEGLTLHYLATETIYHHEGSASRQRVNSFAPLFQRAANHYFLQKNFGTAEAWRYRGAVSIGSMLRLVAGLVVSPFWMLWNGLRNRAPWQFIARHANLFLWSVGLRGMPSR